MGLKPLFFVPKTATKSSLFLRLVFSEFDFCYGAFFRRVLRSELRDLSWMWFVWSGGRDLYGILYSYRESCRRFRVPAFFGGPVSGSVFLLLSSFSFLLLPPFLLLGPARVLFFASLALCLQDWASTRQVRAAH